MKHFNGKKVICLLLALLMVVLTLPAYAEKDLSYLNTDSVMPIVKEGEEVTLKVLMDTDAVYQDMSDLENAVYFFNAYAAKSNVKIEWDFVPKADFGNHLAVALSSNDMPDVIFKGDVSNSLQMKYGKEELFLNLMDNDLLQNYAPNYWSWCQAFPEVLSSSMMPDGAVYSLGMIHTAPTDIPKTRMYFNRKWLEKLNLSVPTTIDEFTNVLDQFKNGDPNGNNEADEVGMYCNTLALMNVTLGSFGVGNRGYTNEYFDWDDVNNCIRYYPTAQGYREWVEWAHSLYEGGLLNQEYLDFKTTTCASYLNSDVCGAYAYTNSLASADMVPDFAYLDGAMTGPNGDQFWRGVNSIGTTGHFIITTECEHPEVALRWVDYFFSDEGAAFFYYGDVGETCKLNEDGTYQYSDDVLAEYIAGTNSYSGCAQKVSLYRGGRTPSATAAFQSSSEPGTVLDAAAGMALLEDCPNAWPSFTFTEDEQQTIDDVKDDINNYVDGKRDAWIMGTEALTDDSWNEYVDQINSMGVQSLLDVYEVAVQRIKANGFVDGYHTTAEFEK
ncbi:MAG: extracellular solute-binding protein [Eubacteriales bacterium]|nr:extracellular solute-binding protein [Eubacteriales bacterium]